MEVEVGKKMEHIFQMKGGTGEDSYANNSKIQNGFLSKSMGIVEQAVAGLCSSTKLPKCVGIADLGCCAGPNSLAPVTKITSAIYKSCHQLGLSPPELSVFLNDLTGNDFNTVFRSIPAFHEKMQQECGPDLGRCFIAGVPGSFYGRLFPDRSLHFVHSSSSLHWLSQVPELTDKVMNKGKIFISKSSPSEVITAYLNQFQRDFSSFLKYRSEEIAPDGRMVLILSGRSTPDPTSDQTCLLWDYLGQAFQQLALEGVIKEEKLDLYNTPYYEPCVEEMRSEIEKEGSFTVDRLGTIMMSWDGVTGGKSCDRATMAQQIGKTIRAVNESMFRNHFGPEILDSLFQRFTNIMAQDTKVVDHVSLVVSLIRKN